MSTNSGRVPSLRTVRITTLGLIVLAGVFYVLSRRDSGVVGSNGVRPLSFVGRLSDGDELCQPLGVSSRRPTSVLLTLGVDGAGPQPLRTRVRGQPSLRIMRRYRDGVVSLPLPTLRATKDAVFCLSNRGSEPVSVGGEAGSGTLVNGEAVPFAVSFILAVEPRRWSDRTQEIFQRIGFARGELSGTFIVALIGLVSLGACVATMSATWRYFQ